MMKRGVCPACHLLVKKTTMDYCLHQHAVLVSMRTSTSLFQKKSVPMNGLMRVSTTLESTLFSCQRYIIVDTTMRNPTNSFTQAQLFCEPTLDTDVLRLPQFMMKAQGNQISRGCLDPSTLTDFRDDLIENWDTIYGHTNYRPAKSSLVVLLTEQPTGRFTRSTSMKYPY